MEVDAFCFLFFGLHSFEPSRKQNRTCCRNPERSGELGIPPCGSSPFPAFPSISTGSERRLDQTGWLSVESNTTHSGAGSQSRKSRSESRKRNCREKINQIKQVITWVKRVNLAPSRKILADSISMSIVHIREMGELQSIPTERRGAPWISCEPIAVVLCPQKKKLS